MINWSCIIQGQSRLEHKLLRGSFQLPDRRMQMGCLAQGLPDPANTAGFIPTACPLPCPPTGTQKPFLCASMVTLISQQCIHHCPMAFWDWTHIVITTNTALRSPNSGFFHTQTQENGFGIERGWGTVWSIVSIRWPGASHFKTASVFPSTQWR